MKLLSRFTVLLLAAAAMTLAGCASTPSTGGWITLLDNGKGLENFDRIGDANWRVEEGLVVADKGKGGHLVTKNSYKDFEIRVEFWAASDTNSGIFMRATDRNKIGSANSYEVNIWDIRPDPKYGTGAIVDIAAVPVPIKETVGGKWNVMHITANGPPVYPFKTIIPIAGTILLAQGLVEIVRCIVCLQQGEWPSRGQDVEEVDVEKLKEMVHVKDEDIAKLAALQPAASGNQK